MGNDLSADHCRLYRTGCPHAGAFAAGLLYRQFCEAAQIFRTSAGIFRNGDSIPQMLVDYIFAFGALGLSGLFSKSKNGLVKGYIAGVLGRYFFAFLSGMIFFGAYAADYGMSAPVYSLVYNGIYLSVEAVLTLIILYLPPVKKVMGQLKTMATQR